MPREVDGSNHWLDGTLYPDQGPPDDLPTLADRVDFLARLCSAWDFRLIPWPESIDEVRQPGWAEAVEACRLLTSPAYHLLRRWHGLEPLTLPRPIVELHSHRPVSTICLDKLPHRNLLQGCLAFLAEAVVPGPFGEILQVISVVQKALPI